MKVALTRLISFLKLFLGGFKLCIERLQIVDHVLLRAHKEKLIHLYVVNREITDR